jgi:predicted ATP-grasp superfamily ATP-dependent carboligase
MRVVLIFSGWNERAVIAFCRYCSNNSIPFVIVAQDKQDKIFYSVYKKNVIYVRQDKNFSADLFQLIFTEIKKIHSCENVLILPTTEYLNRFIYTIKRELESFGYIIPLCDEKLYSLISDKYSFEHLCKINNIVVPIELEKPKEFTKPFVVKPISYFNENKYVAEKPQIVVDEETFEKFKNKNIPACYYQEFIEGDSYYLLYYFSKGGQFSVYSQKNLIQQHNGFSIIAAESSDIHKSRQINNFTNLFLQLSFRGLVMVEVRYINDQFYMIEANPRFWGPSQLILDANMDLFDWFALDWNLLKTHSVKKEYIIGAKYFWLAGICQTTLCAQSVKFHNNYTGKKFVDNLGLWIKSDIYNKKDTKEIFIQELNGQ